MFFNTSPPAVLHHYTDQVGLLGIVQVGGFFATNVEYMNDQTEFFHAIRALKEALRSQRMARDHYVQTWVVCAIQELERVKEASVCAVSFCETRDLLSQWRGYAASGGVSIGFESNSLREVARSEGGMLAKCVYGDRTGIIEKLVNSGISQIQAVRKPNQQDAGRLAIEFVTGFQRYAALFKDVGFQEEAEWRLVTGVRKSLEGHDFRAGRSGLIPYRQVQLRHDAWAGEICEVTIGPCPHKESARRAAQGFLVKHNIGAVAQHSVIPYRNW